MKATPSVLFVDDEPNVLEGIRDALFDEDLEIVTVESGEAGLRAIATRSFDVIVADQKMPGMNGTSFLTLVRNQHPDTIRIMLTGENSFDTVLSAVNEAGIFQLLTKPCGAMELAHTIRYGLMMRSLRRRKMSRGQSGS